MALLPRFSSFGPTRQEFGPFLNLFNGAFNELQKMSDSASRTFVPRFDVKEDPTNYTLEGELPGIDQKDIVVEFADEHTLTIRGRTEQYKEEGHPPAEGSEPAETHQIPGNEGAAIHEISKEVAKPVPGETYWVSERSVGEFARSFAFPAAVDQEHVKGSLKNGILKVVVPKIAKKAHPKKVTIE